MERSAFDALFTTDRLQILKVLLPCLPPGRQGGLAVYIKMQELFRTLDIVRNHSHLLQEALGPIPSGETILEQILPFCSSSQKEQIQQLRQMNRQMDSMREMMETVQMMQSLFPEGMNPEEMDLSQIMTMFSTAGMGGAEGSAASGQSPGSTEDDNTKTPMPDESSVRSSAADMDSPAGSASSWEPGQTEGSASSLGQTLGGTVSREHDQAGGGANPPGQASGGSDPVKTPDAARGSVERTPSPTPDFGREVIQEQMPVTGFPAVDPRDDGARDSEGIPFPAWRTDVQAAARDIP